MTTSVANLDTTQYVKVNTQRESITLQSLRSEVRVVLSAVQPARDNSVFHVLTGADNPMQLLNLETDVWALAVSTDATLVITETGSVGLSSNYFVDVGLGRIPGHTMRAVVARNPDVYTTPEQIWGAGGNMVYPTAAETWEIVSDSVNDTAAGTGARVVLVNSLDDSYNQQQQTVVLDGTTPVALTGTHFRPNGAVVVSSGSSQMNEGDITIRSTATSDPRQYIPLGFAASQDSHYTVPAGFTATGISSLFSFPKDGDGFASFQFRFEGTNTNVIAGDFPFYQNITEFNVTGQFVLPEKTDVFFVGRATNPNTEINTVGVFLVVDNEYL